MDRGGGGDGRREDHCRVADPGSRGSGAAVAPTVHAEVPGPAVTESYVARTPKGEDDPFAHVPRSPDEWIEGNDAAPAADPAECHAGEVELHPSPAPWTDAVRTLDAHRCRYAGTGRRSGRSVSRTMEDGLDPAVAARRRGTEAGESHSDEGEALPILPAVLRPDEGPYPVYADPSTRPATGTVPVPTLHRVVDGAGHEGGDYVAAEMRAGVEAAPGEGPLRVVDADRPTESPVDEVVVVARTEGEGVAEDVVRRMDGDGAAV